MKGAGGGDTASESKTLPSEVERGDMWKGFYISTIFCAVHAIVFPITLLLALLVPNDPAALQIGDEAQLTIQWKLTQMAFITALLLDFISWLFTVNYERARLYYFVLVIQGLPVVSYGLLAAGAAPIMMDVHGRRFIVVRYVVWLFTTPAMLYFYSVVSCISRQDLITAMILEYIVILTGIPACLLPFPYYWPWLIISCVACFFVVKALSKMLTLAIEQSAPDDSSYRSAHRPDPPLGCCCCLMNTRSHFRPIFGLLAVLTQARQLLQSGVQSNACALATPLCRARKPSLRSPAAGRVCRASA